jgi:prophage regulatory protein
MRRKRTTWAELHELHLRRIISLFGEWLLAVTVPRDVAPAAARPAARTVAAPPPADVVLQTRDLKRRLGLSETTIWRGVRDGRFPKPIRLSPGRIGWRESVIEAWLDEREPAGAARKRAR